MNWELVQVHYLGVVAASGLVAGRMEGNALFAYVSLVVLVVIGIWSVWLENRIKKGRAR